LAALLIDSELPLSSALRLAGQGSHDADLSRSCNVAARRVNDGRGLGEALAGLSPFPKSLGPTVVWGERSGALADAFRMAAEMFEGRIDAQLTMVRIVVPPMMFLAVLAAALFLISAIMVPMISLIDLLS
jgi:general secretion pathway protein F